MQTLHKRSSAMNMQQQNALKDAFAFYKIR